MEGKKKGGKSAMHSYTVRNLVVFAVEGCNIVTYWANKVLNKGKINFSVSRSVLAVLNSNLQV